MTHLPDELDQRRTLLDAWVETRRRIAALEAEASALLSERVRLLDDDVRENGFHRDAIHRSMIAEYSAAGRISTGTVERAFSDAFFLGSRHHLVREAFGRGAITAAHAREIIHAGSIVWQAVREGTTDAETTTLYEVAALVVAERDTPARTRTQVRQIAASLAGETLVDRHRRATSERAVTVRSVDDGLALLQIVLPEHLATAIVDRLTQLARQIIATRDDRDPVLDPDALDPDALDPDALDLGPDPIHAADLDPTDPALDALDALDDRVIFGASTFTTDPMLGETRAVEHVAGDRRTIDQVRTDLLTDLLLSAEPGDVHGAGLENIRGRIQVTLSASTLIGADDRPAELDGLGPIDPDIARDLAANDGGWSRLFLDHTGMVTATDAYTPTASMKRLLRARDPHCRFPGCRMPAHRCQIDHNHDHATGGATRLDNLAAFCAGHHALKHPGVDDGHRWSARQLPDGTIEWTSPLGRSYGDPPPRRVMFV